MSKPKIFKIGPNSPGDMTVIWVEPYRPKKIVELVEKDAYDHLKESVDRLVKAIEKLIESGNFIHDDETIKNLEKEIERHKNVDSQ